MPPTKDIVPHALVRAASRLVSTPVFIPRKSIAVFLAFTLLTTAASPLTPKQRQDNVDSFEYVWKAIRDKHWETKPGGLDWQAIHDEFRPAIEKADSMDAARAVLSQMLDRLHQTHFGIVPAELYNDVNGSPAKGENTTGIDVRVIGSHALVTSVESGSSAAHQGVRIGWQIVKIGPVDLDQSSRRSTKLRKNPRCATLSRVGR